MLSVPCTGDMHAVRELFASSSGELQSQLLDSIARSDRKILTRVAADLDCLRALDLWMIDLIPDTRAFKILEDILKVPFSCPALPCHVSIALLLLQYGHTMEPVGHKVKALT